ncbi:MAG: response regulator transcription factor [Flavobacterium sp.]|nr:response regulator transcription factor [Flavobacterium sp.]
MVKVAVADNYPVVHFGIKSYFKDSKEIEIVASLGNFSLVKEALNSKNIDVLLIDLDLNGMPSVLDLKSLLNEFPKTKILIFSNYLEKMYAPNCIKMGVSGYVHKTEKMEFLKESILKVNDGETILNDSIRKSLTVIGNQKKGDRLYRKLSTREIEVLRYLSDGKKNNEIAQILGLNEKTVSTYKLRLLIKLNVTNLLDLVNKAKSLETV